MTTLQIRAIHQTVSVISN